MKKRILGFTIVLCMLLGMATLPVYAENHYYTNDQLCAMAREFYWHENSVNPPYVEVDSEQGNDVILHLFEETSTHTATWAWYRIDRTTGLGIDMIYDDMIDLTKYQNIREDIPCYGQLEDVLNYCYFCENNYYDYSDPDINIVYNLMSSYSLTNPYFFHSISYPYANFYHKDDDMTVNAKAGVDWIAKNIFNISDENLENCKQNALKLAMFWDSDYWVMIDDGENYVSNIGPTCGPDVVKSIDSVESIGDYYFVTYTMTRYYDPEYDESDPIHAILKLKDFDGAQYWSIYYCSTSPEIKNKILEKQIQEDQSLTALHTQEEAVKWIKARKEESWAQDYDGTGGYAQCVDLIKYYFDSIVGYSLLGSGYEYVGRTDLPDGWYYTQTPSPGDIAVWGKWQGIARGDGHVALVESVGDGTFNYVDINGATGLAGKGTIENTNPSAFIHPYFAPATSSKNDWKSLYASKLAEIESQFDNIQYYDGSAYYVTPKNSNTAYVQFVSFQDVDFDGVPEMYYALGISWEGIFGTSQINGKYICEYYYIDNGVVKTAKIKNTGNNLPLYPPSSISSLTPNGLFNGFHNTGNWQFAMRNIKTGNVEFIASDNESGEGSYVGENANFYRLKFDKKSGVLACENILTIYNDEDPKYSRYIIDGIDQNYLYTGEVPVIPWEYEPIGDNAATYSVRGNLWGWTPQYKNISVILNGNEITLDQPPVIINGRTLVPLRAIFEALGAIVGWNGDTQTVTATKDKTVVKISIGNNRLFKNESLIELDVPAQIINDRTLVPVRAISEAFGCKVDWDADTKTVLISSSIR